MELDEPTAALVEVKAGLLLPKDGKLAPDQRRGLIQVVEEGPMMLKLTWSERSGDVASSEPVQEFMVMPQMNSIEFKQIGNPKSRCYVFRMDGSDLMFFWMQEPDAEGDNGCIAFLSQVLLGAEMAEDMMRMDTASSGGPGAEAAASMQTAGAAGGAAGGSGGGGGAGVGASQLAAILGNIMGGGGGGDQGGAAAMQQMMRGMAKAPGPSLGDLLTPEVLLPLLQGKESLERLQEHLPEPHRNFQGLMGVANSPQFQQQLETFSHALQTGQLDVAQFGLDAKGFSVADFLESIQAAVAKEEEEEERKKASEDSSAGGGVMEQ